MPKKKSVKNAKTLGRKSMTSLKGGVVQQGGSGRITGIAVDPAGPVAPAVMDGTSNTLMIGEVLPKP
ncbi:MAG TPA: hypothetical protein VE981_10625 [Planctomycetota bacterium]|nr:hypothetical protein [Planctomycetota bacterium]